MDAAEERCVLARYDAEIRADPPAEIGVQRVWADGVLRTDRGLQLHRLVRTGGADDRPPPPGARRRISATASPACNGRSTATTGPKDLGEALRAAGFEEDEWRLLVVLDLEAIRPAI